MPDRTCSIDGCDRPVRARGWCGLHYQRWKAHGNPLGSVVASPKPICSIDGCEDVSNARGLCDRHYQDLRRRGQLPELKPRPKVCIVDGCGRSVYGHGWCQRHYTRWRNYGDPNEPADNPPAGKPPFGMKWCRRCKTYRPLGEFYVGKKGPESPCKTCRAIRDKRYRQLNPPRTRADANRRRRARMAAARSEHYTAEEIAERDGWRCQICGHRIGKSLKFPHKRSLSIDHVIPLADGGDDVKANVQAVHFRCNASKGPRGVDQLRLIG